MVVRRSSIGEDPDEPNALRCQSCSELDAQAVESEAASMWGKSPFSIPDGYAIDVRNLTAARERYKKKLDLHDLKTDREDDSRRPFVDLHISNSGELLSLAECVLGAAVAGR
jgi:hypothetical protein